MEITSYCFANLCCTGTHYQCILQANYAQAAGLKKRLCSICIVALRLSRVVALPINLQHQLERGTIEIHNVLIQYFLSPEAQPIALIAP